MHGKQFKMNVNELKDLAVDAARQAGDFLNQSKFEKKEVYKEEGRDIKLIIDQDTEKLIRTSLLVTDIPILGEEYGGEISEEKYWVIDPIDGTANYFRGLDECCVSIALMEGEEALVGVIYNFNNNQMYTAIKNEGAFLKNNSGGVFHIYFSSLELLGGVEHSVLHEPPVESPVHPLQAVPVPDALEVLSRLEDEAPRIVNAHPDGVAPGRDRLPHPVGGAYVLHLSRPLDQLGVFLDGNEVRVRPLLVEELEVLLVLLRERDLAVIPLAPRCHDELAPRL